MSQVPKDLRDYLLPDILDPDNNSILARIVRNRMALIQAHGLEFGHGLAVDWTPGAGYRRAFAPFAGGGVICEVKRQSPSKGPIDVELDPVSLARSYIDAGVQSISVLTEPDFFKGSLRDLAAIRGQLASDGNEKVALLRKDFLVHPDEVAISARWGADAVLLLANVLSDQGLDLCYRKAQELGMAALVEVHDFAELERVRPLKPQFTGVNCRDLRTFTLDLLNPLVVGSAIDWRGSLVYESGISRGEQARLAFSSGAGAVLVGEAAVKDSSLPSTLVAEAGQVSLRPLWHKIAASLARVRSSGTYRPLVKICGLTREEDVRYAAHKGADLLGFIWAYSPRRIEPSLLERLADIEVPKVLVVVEGDDEDPLEPWILDALDRGLIDGVQLHGDSEPEFCAKKAFPYYKALAFAPGDRGDRIELALDTVSGYHCPRVLIDGFSEASRGGTGRMVDRELLQGIKESHKPLWLAGGLNPDNIAAVVREFMPELVDVSSGIELEKGVKDYRKIDAFFEEIHNVC